MAFPVIAVALNSARVGIGAVIDFFIGWFGRKGILAGFFTQLGAKLTSKAYFIAKQIATGLALVALHLAMMNAVWEVYKFIANSLNIFKSKLPILMTQNDTMTLAYTFMRSIGLIDAFLDAFALFDVLLFSLITALIAKMAFHTLKVTADESFKLSILMQQ